MKNSPFVSEDGHIEEYLGEKMVMYDKVLCKFVTNTQRRDRKRQKGGASNWSSDPNTIMAKRVLETVMDTGKKLLQIN